MKTVKYLAEKNCKVKVNGVFYSGDKVLPSDMSDEEIKRLLAAKFIRKITLDEGEETDDDSANHTKDSQSDADAKEKRKALIAEAKKYGIAFTAKATDEEIQHSINDAKEKERKILLAKAAELKLTVTDEMTAEEIQQLVAEAEKKAGANQ